MQQITRPDQVRIAAHADVAPNTVHRAYAGGRSHSTTRARIERAARELGLPLPPSPTQGTAPEQAA